MRFKIEDKVRLKGPTAFMGMVGVIKGPDIGGVINDYDWIVEIVPVWEFELELLPINASVV